MRDYRRVSYWLESSGDDLTPRPALGEDITAEVAILGAGYSGLWTAYYLLQRDPHLRVVLLEAEIAGFGASGRNGGWCLPGISATPGRLAREYSPEVAREMELTMFDTVDEVGRVTAQEGIDAHYTKGGMLRIARGPHQLPTIQEEFRLYNELGLGDHYRLLDAGELEERIRVTKALGALYTPDCATLHPGRLVRGLARAVERHCATIYEQTPVTEVIPGAQPLLRTPRGTVRADVAVLAGEAYLSRLPGLNRQITPVYSLITLTEPLSEAQWEEIGWRHRECVDSVKYTVDYLTRTADGRILFGSRGAPYHWGARIADEYDRYEPVHRWIQQMVREWFPSLQNVQFTHSWGGPVGMPRDQMPSVTYNPVSGLATARGYTGQGVATTNLAGRILADLITGHGSPLTALPIAGHQSPDWEPEPLRFAGIRFMQWAYGRIDEKAARTGKPPTGRSLAERLGAH